MERCREVSARMKEAAASAGYGAGAEMASLLGGIFEDATEIVNRPVDDGFGHIRIQMLGEPRIDLLADIGPALGAGKA